MCGIAGTFSYNGGPKVVEEQLLRVRDRMTARGPDSAGIWISPDQMVGLAHRRLAIIDLSESGAQPMATTNGRLRIIFNGEIYNYKELRVRLENKGARFRSNSDTEVLLHLYAEKGPEMVGELRGMFSFMLWDEHARGVLLGRDPFGIKPLYYQDDGHTLRAASQVKALLAGGSIDTAPEPAGHVGFFLWGYVPEPYTLHKGIRMLPAGSTLWINATGQRRLNRFCDVCAELAGPEDQDSPVSQQDILTTQERLKCALKNSMRHHLVADVPVGVFLSAGLDSNTLASLAGSELGSGSLRTITLGFREYRGTQHDETPLSEKTASRFGAVHRTCWISAADFRNNLPRLLDAMDQPSTDGVNTYFVSKVAAESGLKVALSGLGGDELFGGYSSFRQIPPLVRASGFTRHIPSFGIYLRRISSTWMSRFTSPKYAGLFEYGNTYGGAYLLRRALFMPWELPQHLDADLVYEGWKELRPLERLEETTRPITAKHLKVSALELNWYMRNQLLRDADWAGMAHSLEIRVPLVDIALLRAIKPLLASKRPPTKLDMALCPDQALPDEVLHRRKTGFNVPVHDWLMPQNGQTFSERGLRGWAKLVYQASTKS